MNIVQLQKQIENPSVTNEQLIQYIQNPNSGPPGVSILALAELERRKKLQAQPKTQGAQQPSVAEQLIAEATPQPGIAGISVTNIGNEEAYAAGGIVAFEEGGDVQGYKDGEEVKRKRFGPEDSLLNKFIIPFTDDPQGYMSEVYETSAPEWYKKRQREQSKYAIPVPKATKQLKEDTGIKTLTPTQAVKPAATPAQSPMVYSTNTPEEIAAKSAQLLRDRFNQPEASEVPAAPAGRGGPAPLPTASAPAVGFDVEPMKFDDAMYEQMMRKAPTLQEGMKEYMGALGEDPTRAKMAERINQMTEANELYKKQFPWMALAEAGFGMAAGRSPFALQNIAEGGKQGLASFAAGRKETRDQEEKMFNLQAKISEAERAEKKAALDYGFNSKERIEASNERIKLEKIRDKQATNIANQELGIKKANYAQEERKMQEAAKHNRATEAYYNKTPAEIQVVERMMKDPEFAKKYTELQGVKYRPKADAAKLAAADKSYDNYVKNFRPFKGADGKIVTNPESREVYLRKNFPELVDYTAAGSAEYTYNPKTGKLE